MHNVARQTYSLCTFTHRFSSGSPCFLQNMTCCQCLTPVSQPRAESSLSLSLSQNRGSRILMFWLQLCIGQQKIYTTTSTSMKRGKEKRHCDKLLCEGLGFFWGGNIRAVAEYLLVTCVSTILKDSSSAHYSAGCCTHKKKLLFIC